PSQASYKVLKTLLNELAATPGDEFIRMKNALPSLIEDILNNYDQRKGILRRLFGDNPSIKLLRNLTATNRVNVFSFLETIGSIRYPSFSYSAAHTSIRYSKSYNALLDFILKNPPYRNTYYLFKICMI